MGAQLNLMAIRTLPSQVYGLHSHGPLRNASASSKRVPQPLL